MTGVLQSSRRTSGASALNTESPIILPRAVLFDMDGTLTSPNLDFARIREAIGIEAKQAILETLALMPEAQRIRAEATLHRFEEEAARNSTLNHGCREVLAWLDARGVRTALITRNSRSSVTTVLAMHGLAIDVLISREDKPHKPAPDPLYLACRRLEVSPAEAWMVGDGEYDVQAGLKAGCRTVWLSHRQEKHFPETPWCTVDDLWGFLAILEGAKPRD